MPAPAVSRLRRFVTAPPKGVEIVVWIVLVGFILLPRLWLMKHLPGYLWSKDAGSYCEAVFHWLDTGLWESDPRRGPIYSLLIAAVLKLWGNFNALMAVQHILGGISVLAAIITLRVMYGAKSLLPVLVCGAAYALSAGPLSMEHLVRNETVLLFFATGALTGWYLALRTDNAGWLALAGLSAGLLSLTKNVFVPFPLMVVAGAVWLHRKDWRKAVTHVLVFCAALALPLLGGKYEKTMGTTKRPPEPQAGILLFGRVAQFTKLDGGIEPEIKALIRPDIESYLKLIDREGDLDNNIILKRTAVPRMRKYVQSKGGTPSDLNRLCKALAIEAIRTHPREYVRQVLGDMWDLHVNIAARMRGPDRREVEGTINVLSSLGSPHPSMHATENIRVLQPRANKEHFFPYVRMVDWAWMFLFAPVFLTTLILPVLIWRTHGYERWFWIGCAALWYFTAVLLSTVGKPMNRYVLPVTPIMFWALASAVVALWCGVLRLIGENSQSAKP